MPADVDSYGYWAEQVKAPGRVEYVDDPLGSRGIVQRVEVQPGDIDAVGSGKGERAEVTNSSDLSGFVDGQTLVMSWGLMIDSTFASPPGTWNSFVQIHASGGGNQAPVSLRLAGDEGDLSLGLFGGGDWIPSGQPQGSVGEVFELGLLPKNQWHDFVLELRFGCTGTGYVRLWRDGQEMVDAYDRKIGYCGDPALYWKQGFYRVAYDKVTRLWFSDTLRWANTADVCSYYWCSTAKT
ncbi:heparin lyase I family protein [Mycolicibacterium sp. CH28]|uniref:heparin lyase I family protein n=1 Tax=Mycolicibacterium sp. CH28 TaxID=2512237 RepID=UPI001386E6F0|nr:heparin lyase I family protein [Mycolicibacterium sp. CH28]